MTQIEQILIKRDGMTPEEAKEALEAARERVSQGDDFQEVLEEEFGLEPDYFLDLLP
jgi:hypothetical protein